MSAVGGFVPIEESRIDPLAPQSRRLEHFARENAHGDRQIEPLRREIGRESIEVEARGGRGRVGEPIERDVVEHLVARDFPLRFVVAVGPLAELFVDPRRLAGGRVRQRVADRLRPGGLNLGVTRSFIIERNQLGNGRFLRLVGFALDRRRKQNRQIEMDRREPLYVLFGHPSWDARAPVAALREIVGVAETPHQLRPCPRDARQPPAALGRFAAKAKARKRRNTAGEGASALPAALIAGVDVTARNGATAFVARGNGAGLGCAVASLPIVTATPAKAPCAILTRISRRDPSAEPGLTLARGVTLTAWNLDLT